MVEFLVGAGVAHDDIIFDGPAADARLALAAGRPFARACLEAGVEEVATTVSQPVVAVEAARGGKRGLVPFAGDEGAVAHRAQDLAEGGAVLHTVVTDCIGVVTGEQFGPGGVALGGVVELLEPQAVFGERIDVGRLHLAAVASKIGVAHVIHHDENDVGPGAVWRRLPKRRAKQETGEEREG